MKTLTHSYRNPTLDVVETLRDESIHASIEDLRKRDRFTLGLRAALRNGVRIEELSAASGLTCEEIRRRVDSELMFGEDLDALTGVA